MRADDLHFTAAPGMGERVDLPYLLDALPPGLHGILWGR
jgi:hypothetical protein